MNATDAQPGLGMEATCRRRWLWVALAVAVGFLAVSNDSLWVDEALTANEVSHASLRGMWEMLARDKGSDLQMPLYLFHLWAWVKIFGTSEWALRAVNIPWFVAAAIVCIAAFEGRERAGVLIAACLSPFAWYFLNEARPYAVQISASLMAFAALCRLAGSEEAAHERAWLAVFSLGVVCLSASSLLGMVWAGGFVLAAAWCVPSRRWRTMLKTQRGCVLLTAGLLVLIGGYYIWTLQLGARATAGTTDARNLLFIAYELLGFGGLGPGRLEIRGGSLAAFHPYVVRLAIYGVLLALVGFWGVAYSRRRWSAGQRRGVLMIIVPPALVLIVAGYALHFRILERHFAPAVAVIVYLLGCGLAEGWRHSGLARLAVCGFAGVSLVACLEVRLALRHKKDDYRDAAADAIAALGRGERVWWNAGWHGAVYYHLPLGMNSDDRTSALWVLNSIPAAPSRLPAPDLVISSKPDMFDQLGTVAEFLRNGPYQAIAEHPAFTEWRRTSPAIGK